MGILTIDERMAILDDYLIRAGCWEENEANYKSALAEAERTYDKLGYELADMKEYIRDAHPDDKQELIDMHDRIERQMQELQRIWNI